MMLVPIALVALIAWAALYLLRSNGPEASAILAKIAPAPRNGAERIAAERLARGEIDAIDYERILAVLRQ
jgi:uncharacterized membrane protein